MRIRVGDGEIYVDFISVNGALQLQSDFLADYFKGAGSTIVVSRDQIQEIRKMLKEQVD